MAVRKEYKPEIYDTLSYNEKINLRNSAEPITVARAETKNKLAGFDVLMEYKKRYNEGLYRSAKYSLDDILDFKITKNAGVKDYGDIVHREVLPGADEFISDDAVIAYVKRLCLENTDVQQCNTLQEIANEIYEGKLSTTVVTFQNASLNGGNFLSFNGDYGWVAGGIRKGGPFAVPEGALEGYARDYPLLCQMKGNEFIILDYEEFGKTVLSGVPLSQAGGAYLITSNVPISGKNICMPSVANGSAYMPYFVSGGRLLSNQTEVTIKPLQDIVYNSTSIDADDTIKGTIDGIEYVVRVLK